MSDSVLEKICAKTREHVRLQKETLSLADLEAKVRDMPATRGFRNRILDVSGQVAPPDS